MKKVFSTIVIFSFVYSAFSQSASELGKLSLSVNMPKSIDELDNSQLLKLETKITQILSSSGITASAYNNNFVIYPKFTIYKTDIAEGGMQNITVVTAEVSLFIKQIDNNILFSSTSKEIKGSGNNKLIAITDAISKIPANDIQFKTFIETGKNKIIQYYESKCQDIILKSESLAKMQEYEQALGLLMTVPEEVSSCYNKIQEKSIEIYKAYKNHICSKQIQDARANITAHKYNEALEILGQIDPSTSCFNEAKTLMQDSETKVDAEEKKQWDLKMKMYDSDVALEKERINAIKDIAVAHYKSNPTTINHYK